MLWVFGASCTPEQTPARNSVADGSGSDQPAATGGAGRPLTAAFEEVPMLHPGESAFSFRVAFSEDIDISYRTLRDESFTVTKGAVTQARRIDGRDDLWEITVAPESREAVTITLPGGRACGASGAVCTGGNDPAPLGNSPSATVSYRTASVLQTHLHVLAAETVEFERFAGLNTGGAIESLGDDLLLATPSGRLLSIAADRSVEYLAGQVPMNRSALKALGLEPVVEGRFRVADILLKEESSSGGRDLFVTHHFFAGECGYRFRLSSTTLSRVEGRLPILSPWKTIFDAEPCLTVATLRQGNQAGGKMLTDGPDHLLVLIGDHGKNGYGFGRRRHPRLSQDPDSHIGKLVRIDIGTGAAEVLTLGHRNPQGFARDHEGRLWATEHGPRGGDELNLLEPGNNYGWPLVSYGTTHGGRGLSGRAAKGQHDGFAEPVFSWVPSIGISGMVVNDARAYPSWKDDLLITSLRGRSIFRVRRSGDHIRYVEKIAIRPGTTGGRIRDITHMADGLLALLVDRSRIVFLHPL